MVSIQILQFVIDLVYLLKIYDIDSYYAFSMICLLNLNNLCLHAIKEIL